MGTNYKLEKVDRGNWKVCGSYFTFYITFVAAKESSEHVKESVEIQAKMLQHEEVPEVLECLLTQDMEALIETRLALKKIQSRPQQTTLVRDFNQMEEKEDAVGNNRKLSGANLETEKKWKLGKGVGSTGKEEYKENDKEEEQCGEESESEWEESESELEEDYWEDQYI
ncbi:hypothetical protein OROMI_011183 [Orobanche minor]